MAETLTIVGKSFTRLDDRQSTLGNTDLIECSPDITILPPGALKKYGTLLIGLTSTGDINGPLIMDVREVWNFGVFRHRSQLFPGGLPDGYDGLLWDVWFVSSLNISFDLIVGGVR
jgi:hypothetical protein